ncbi:conjugal transfer protein MobB [Chryseobacterium sp.]|uniref:conjugal transfer protein MobB n=1 Tax=Chryseobacterium sp. TaxID=1871047 RepID=UPI002897B81F|nr:conjugal transfer protein MobB [Chryseobacterium sp.]
MIAKIGRGTNLFGALSYNNIKVEQQNGKILFTNKMIETIDGKYTVSQLAKSFDLYLAANKNTEKTTLHISLNPDPKDKVSDKKYIKMAQDYMNEMGYGKQPYVVFKHTDIDRPHIHIVTVSVDEQGNKISDKFEKRKSMKVCRSLEQKYHLINATDKDISNVFLELQPVDYQKGHVKNQMTAVINKLLEDYKFQTIGEYNALLSLYNITTEKVQKNEKVTENAFLYFASNNKGEKSTVPFKSSLFGDKAGVKNLTVHFAKSKEWLKLNPAKNTLKTAISSIMKIAVNEGDFKSRLEGMNIQTVIRKNDSGRIYGVTFIDHNSKAVYNGSNLCKEFSANVFNDWWNNRTKPDLPINFDDSSISMYSSENPESFSENSHELFNFFENVLNFTVDGFSILPENQGEDYEELQFEKITKRKRAKKR